MTRTFALIGALLFWQTALANHPLLTDDTETLGRGRSQLELHGERARGRDNGARSYSTETAASLSYGLGSQLDVQIELPYLHQHSARGRGDVELELKWNFFERDGVGFMLKPRAALPTGDHEQGLGAGRARFGADFLAARQTGEFELIGHAGYLRNRNRLGERSSLWHVSAALLWAVTERLKWFVDLSRDSNPQPTREGAIRELAWGFQYELSSAVDFGLGLKNGLSEAADDLALLAGLRLRW